MLADGLVGELHIFMYPLTRGQGPRLFPSPAAPRKLTLARSEVFEHGVVYLNYRTHA
jgi:dihydrofolate reductase